jgi:NIPSNAP
VTEYQLRMYTIEQGRLAQFVDEWRTAVVPLRRRFGFEIVGAWQVPADDLFVWVLAYGGPGDFAARDRAYYDSLQRAALAPNPARLIRRAETRLMHAVGEDDAEPA